MPAVVTRQEWIAIAEVLAGLRASIVGMWPPPEGYNLHADVILHRKLVYLAQLEAIDKVTVMLAATMEGLSEKFERKRFLRIVRGTR